jgi:hypothetical protein
VKRNRIPPLLVSVLLARRVQEGIRTSGKRNKERQEKYVIDGNLEMKMEDRTLERAIDALVIILCIVLLVGLFFFYLTVRT